MMGKIGPPGPSGKSYVECQTNYKNIECSSLKIGDVSIKMRVVEEDDDVEIKVNDKSIRLFNILERLEKLEKYIDNHKEDIIKVTI